MIPYNRPKFDDTFMDRVQKPSGLTFSKRFDNEKIKKVRSYLSRLPQVFEEVTGTVPKLPRRIYTMTQSELRRSKKVRANAGHGYYEAETDTVKVNPAMSANNILFNVIHEMLHADLPWLAEKEVDRLSDKIFDRLRPTVGKEKRGTEPTPLNIDATRLVRGLWIGSKPEIGRAVAESGFDLLVLCAEEYQPPAWQFPGVEVIHAPFDDNDIGPLPNEKKIAQEASKSVVSALRQGSNVLVTCYAGRNRSGLVCGLALVETGHTSVQALTLIRDKRENSLTNRWFVDLIAEVE